MAFIDAYLPLPTEPIITSTFTFDSQVLKNGAAKEQRYNRLTEWYSTYSLSDVTFTEAELETFINFWQALGGKRDSFRFTNPLENFAQSIFFNYRNLDSHMDYFYSYSHGAAIPVDANGLVEPIDGVTLYTRWQLVKVYSLDPFGTVYANVKTIRKPQLNTVRLWDNEELIAGVDFTVDHNTGIVTTTSGYATDFFLNAQFSFDVEARIDMDEIPQIILSRGKFTDNKIQYGVQSCDRYQFSSLNIVEVPDCKLNKDEVLMARIFADETYLSPGADITFELDYKPIESIARKFQVRLEETINKFQTTDEYSRTTGDLIIEYEDTALRNLPTNEIITGDDDFVKYTVGEYVSNFYFTVMGKWRTFSTEYYYNPASMTERTNEQFVRFDTDLTIESVRQNTGCDLHLLKKLVLVQADSAEKSILGGNTLPSPTFPEPGENPNTTCPLISEFTQLDELTPTGLNMEDWSPFNNSWTNTLSLQLLFWSACTDSSTALHGLTREGSTSAPPIGGVEASTTIYYGERELTPLGAGSSSLVWTGVFVQKNYRDGVDASYNASYSHFTGDNFFFIQGLSHIQRVETSSGINVIEDVDLGNGWLSPFNPQLTTTSSGTDIVSYHAHMFYQANGDIEILVKPLPRELVGLVDERPLRSSQDFYLIRVEFGTGKTLLDQWTMADLEAKLGISLADTEVDRHDDIYVCPVLNRSGTTRQYFVSGNALSTTYVLEGATFNTSTLKYTKGGTTAEANPTRAALKGAFNSTCDYFVSIDSDNTIILDAETLQGLNSELNVNRPDNNTVALAAIRTSPHKDYQQMGNYIYFRTGGGFNIGLNKFCPASFVPGSNGSAGIDRYNENQLIGLGGFIADNFDSTETFINTLTLL